MFRSLIVSVVSLAMASVSLALPQPGDAAPPLTLTEVTNAPDGTPKTLAELKGKTVVLEFWATWCGPCVGAIPHLNELAEHYADADDIVFLSVTGEAPEIVSPFLEDRPMRAWIGHDKDGLTMDSYEIRFLPTTIVIGKDGVIASVTSPRELTTERIDGYRAGARDAHSSFAPGTARMMRNSLEVLSNEITSWSPGVDPFTKLEGDPPAFQVIVRENPYAKSRRGRTSGALTSLGVSAAEVIESLSGVSRPCIILPEHLAESDALYDLVVTWPQQQEPTEALRLAAVQLAAAAFGCSVEFREEDLSGYLITRFEKVPLPPKAEQSMGWRVSETAFSAEEGMHMAPFISVIERLTGKKVANGLGAWEIYNFPAIEFAPDDIDSLNAAMREQYGIQLEPHTFKNQRVARLVPLDR